MNVSWSTRCFPVTRSNALLSREGDLPHYKKEDVRLHILQSDTQFKPREHMCCWTQSEKSHSSNKSFCISNLVTHKRTTAWIKNPLTFTIYSFVNAHDALSQLPATHAHATLCCYFRSQVVPGEPLLRSARKDAEHHRKCKAALCREGVYRQRSRTQTK